MKIDETKSTDFLLGRLSQTEAADIENAVFSDDTAFESLLLAESGLIDAYATDRLSPEDRELFENRLLLNPRQRQRAKFAEALVMYASRIPREDIAVRSKWLGAIGSLFSFRLLPVYSMAAVVLLAVGGAALWLNFGPRQDVASVVGPQASVPTISPSTSVDELPAGVESGIAGSQINESSFPPEAAKPADKPSRERADRKKASVPTIATIMLSMGTTRGSGPEKAHVIPHGAGVVSLQMNTDNDEFSSFFVNVETVDGQQVWGQKVRGAGKSSSKVGVKVPARRLQRGDYIVTLKGLTPAGVYETVGEYSFSVDRGR